MRKPTNLRLILLTLFLLQSYFVLAQNHVPFTSRFDTSIRGDMMLIGNSIVNRDNNKTGEYANDAFTGAGDNNGQNMQYIDIDNDPNTFSSSSATLKVPDASRACYNIVYAGLYWSGVYTEGSLNNKSVTRSELGNVKFKLANETVYNNISGELIYDYYNNNPRTTNGDQIPYAYYANVTKLLKDSKNPEGEYTVANINSARGRLSNGGYAAGWSLFVIYEDPKSSAKYITAYDGFSWIKAGGQDLTYSVSGFKTIPTGNVKVKLAFSALEGDAATTGDTYSVNGTQVYTNERKTNNFFCSVINDLSGNNLARNPASTNTLGFDAGIIDLRNTNNSIIKNGDSKANLKLTTSGDGYGVYFNAFNVEVIAPQISLTKLVKDTDGKDIGGQNVTLGQQLRYEINIQNVGNDDATSLVITDQLPINVIFDQTKDLLPLPKGIVVKTPYNPVTRKIVFEVTDPKLITKNNPTVSTIAFKVQVVPDCHALSEACSNSIDNQAFATYRGKENTSFAIDETDPQGSVNSTEGCAVTPKATNFLVGVDGCEYTENVTLCTDSVDLIPAKGYEKYTWYSDAKMTIKIGEGNPFNVTKEGTYYVYNLAEAPCRSISQSFVVTRFKSTTTNPVIPFASEVLTCADTGQPFPNIYLCGGNAKKEIKTNITDASNIVWERFVEGSCTVSTGKNCPNDALASTGNPSELCKWDQVGTGSDYTANKAGKYRLTVTYKGGVCFNRFYFDVYQNTLTPTEKHTDIICSSNGSITVEGVPAGYEYAISKDPSGPIGAYQSSNIFPISTEGSYTVHVRQTNVTTFPCDFTVENILIRKLDVDVNKVITQPLCAGAKGTVVVAANNVNPNYTFVITQGGAPVQTIGPTSQKDANFELLAGDYVLTVTTADGCSNISDIKIVAPDPLTAAYDVKSLTACSDGEITVTPKGGTAPYFYSINGQPYVSENKIPVTNPGGSYSIIVTDSNDCSYTIPTFSVNPIAKPTVTINSNNLSCYNAKEGEISISVTPADSGYTVSYNVNGGTFTTLPTSGLTAGDYKVIVKYTIGGVECTDPEKTITITGPSATLTASAGVAELSGCGPAGNTKQGMVRITNPQGGVPFPAPNLYRYSFDGGNTYITDNFAYINPSTTPITLYIKDAAGCIFPMSGIILDEKPADPIFSEPVLTYNCKGEGTATVTVNADASPNYSYSYYLGKPDPANPSNYIYTLNTNSPANIFKDIPVGDYKIKVEYNLVSVPTFSNLLKEDFGSGPPTKAPGIATAYCFNDQRVNPPYLCKYPDGTPSRSVEDNAYSVASFFWRDDDPNSNNSGAWFHYKDHTTNPNNLDNTGDPNGRYLLVNVGNAAGKYGILYSKPIVDVIPNQDVIVDFYVGNLLMPSYNSAAPIIRIELIDSNGNVVARDDTGEIAPGLNHPDRKKWVPISIKLNPGDNKNLTFVIRSGSEVFNGNDLVIDDIWVRQLPKSCLQAKTLDLKVQAGQGFKAEVKGITGVSCNGGNDGGFSIYAENFNTTDGFFYTLNGGATNPTWVNSKVSPVVISGKSAGLYDVRVRYANDAASCNATIPTTIPSKDPFVVNATASTATCKGATVTATATGGTPAYTLTLKDKNSPYTRVFPIDGILNEVPAGTYIISGVDSKSCSDAMDTELVIDPASIPKAEVVQNTGLCFDNNIGATITVNIIGGVGPFTYKVSTDGGTTYGPQSATFTTTSFDYKVTATGTYSFLITDGNSCDALAVSQTIGKQLSARSSISGALTCTTGKATIEVTIEGGTTPFKYVVRNKATNATLFTSGDIAGPTFTYTDVPGTYVFTITDKNGCTAVEEKEIKQLEPVTAEHKVENVTCYNADNGYVDITPLTGQAPFTYQFNGTGAFSATTHYGNLKGSVAGIDYSYTIKDNLGCEETYTFKVFQPEDLVPSASITAPYTCLSGATITASAIGGNGGYTFELRNTTTNTVAGTNTTGLFENLTTPGSYSVTVTDSKNCTKTITVPGQIIALNPPAGMTIDNNAVTCPSNKATVTITNVVNASNVAVPTAGLEYRIKAPAAYATTAFQPSNSFAGLDAGVTYTFEVRDANKCVYEKIHEIKSLPVITVSVASKSNVECSGESNGTATFTVSGLGNDVNYSYVVDSRAAVAGTSPSTGASFDITVTGLNAGNHLFTITNTATSCPASETVTIADPATPLSKNPEALTHVTCDVKGTATINVVGGWGSYSYVVTPPAGTAITQTTSLFTDLAAGNYTYTVTDLNGCSVNGSFTINDKVDPIASIDTTTDYCASGTGATIRVTPNTAPNYVYTITGGAQQNNGTFNGLIPGSYVVTVTDTSTGCSIDLPSTTIASPVEASIKLNKDLDCDPINPNAIIEVTVRNGYPDYRYRVSTNGSGFSGAYIPVGAGQTVFTHTTTTGANAATYEFEILDSNDCRTTVTQNIAARAIPDFSFEIEHVKCHGGTTGMITVTGIPANGTYEYSIDGGPFQPANVFTGLGQGTYQVTIKDDKKCERTKSVTVNEPAIALSASAVATDLKCGTSNAPLTSTITVTAANGTPFTGTNKYKYYYNGSTTFVYSNTYTTSTSGVVDIIVEDANGCTTTTSATVNTLNPPSALAFSAPAITCDPTKLTTDLLVTVTNGVLPLKYEITSTTAAAPATPVVTNVNSNTYTFSGLAPGNYNFKITDKNDCTVTGSYEIKEVVKISASNRIVKNVSCNNGNDGEIEFTISGNTTGGYGYTLTGSATGPISGGNKVGDVITYTGLTPQTYTFVVTNTDTTCDATQIVTLVNPDVITIDSAVASKVFCDKPNTTIKVIASGGTGTLHYAVVGATEATPTFPTDYNTSGIFTKNTTTLGLNYNVYVQDDKGCPIQTTVSVIRNNAPTIDPAPTTCFTGSASVTITGTVYGGTALYGIDGVYSTNPTKTITAPGSYVLSIKDDNGCEEKTTLVVNDQLILTVTPNKDATCSAVPPFTTADAQVTLSATGGDGTNYVYGYSTSSTGPFTTLPGNVFNTSIIGTYYFNVTSDGCSAISTVSFEVTTPQKPTATATSTDPKCYNVSEGTIKVTGHGGVPGYQYRINGGAWQDSPIFTDLAAAVAPGTDYTYEVRDTKGCISDPETITLVQPSQIVVNRTLVGITCNSTNGVSLGSISIDSVTGGTGPYDYYVTGRNYNKSFSNVPGTAQVFEIVDFGIYEIRIIDANNCSYIEEVTITSPPEDLDITVTAPPPADCTALGSAIVAVGSATSIPVGNGPFYFSYYTGVKPVYPTTGTWYPETTPLQTVIPNLIPGVRYTFIVYDSKSGCYYYEIADMPIPSNSTLTVGAPTAQNVTCTGSSDGKVSFVVSSTYGTDTPITYQVYDALSLAPLPINGSGTVPANGSLTISGFGAMPHGDYFVLVKEDTGATNAGCSKSTAMFSIRQSAVLLVADYEIVKNDNCKSEAGVIRVSGREGTAPYKYMVTTTATTPDALDTAWTSVPVFNRDSNNYYAWVKDAYGCIQGTPVFLLPLDPTPVISLDVVNYCAGEGAFEVTVTVDTPGIAPHYISVNNGNFTEITGLTHTIQNLNSGSVSVVVRDANGCESTAASTLINATPIASALVTKVLDCSVAGNAVANAEITVTVSKGTTPYATYEVKKGSGSYAAITPTTTVVGGKTTFVYSVSAIDADTYQFKITDAHACPVETGVVRVDAIVPITPSSNPVQPLCNGGNGTVELSAVGGKAPYKFAFNGSGVFSDETVYSVAAGPYTYIVRDDLGCEVTGNGTLGQPTPLADNGPSVQGLKCTTGNGTVPATVILAATPGSGSGSYLYSFNGSDFTTTTTYTVDKNEDQTIPYIIKDTNGCEISGTVNIYKLNPPTNFTITKGPVITCTTLNTTATISAVQNGVGTFTYQIISPASSVVDNGTVATFTNLLPDVDYVFQVTDENGCTAQKSFRIDNVININIVEQSKTPITCLGTPDGKASFFVSGFGTGVGTYHYVLDTDPPVVGLTSSTIDLIGLSAGSHTITVYDDATNCNLPITFTISAPPAALALAPLNVTPKGCTTFGGVTMTASDGWGDYTYYVQQPDGSILSNKNGTFGNLIQLGLYNVYVIDANGCRIDDSFRLILPVDPSATIAAASDYCYVNGANTTTLVVTATSTSTFDVRPFQYSINNGQTWQFSDTFSNLSPGNYTIVVKDKFGCKSTAVNTEIKGQLYASANIEKPIYCTGALPADGIIRIQAVGGYAPYRYTVTYNSVTSALNNFTNALYSDYTVSNSANGVYVFEVYDAHDCHVATNTVDMVAPTAVTFTADPYSPNCSAPQGNVTNGSILVTLAPGNDDRNYTYTIQRTIPAGGALISQSTPLFTGLIAGTYTVTVISGKQCSDSKPVIIDEPTPVVAAATPSAFECSGTNTTKSTVVTVTATGGAGGGVVGNYTYSNNRTNWKTENTFTVNNEVAQNLTFYAKDANGCIDDVTIPIEAFPKLTAAVATLGDKASCANNGRETIHVEITGGTSPANFNYEVYQDGQILQTATPVGLSNTSFDYIAPTAGHFYQFKIIDNVTSCSIMTNAYQVPLYNTAKVIATASASVSCNGGTNGEITIDVIDYKGPYTYQVYNAGVAVGGASGSGDSTITNPLTISNMGAGGVYTVVITETNYPFCPVTSNTFEITQPPVLDLISFVPTVKNQNCNSSGAVITIDETQIVGGTKGYKYVAVLPTAGVPADGAFKTDKIITIPTTAIAPAFDTWHVYVMDAKGCKAFVPVNISLDPMPAITNVSVVSPCYDVAGYRIDVAAIGVAPLEYSLDGKQYQSDAFFIVKDAGDYTVRVRDANKCVVTATTAFNIPEPLTLKADITTEPTCMTASGVVTLTAGGGRTPANYVYTKDNWTNISLTNVFTGLAPGSYRFIVRDVATNCEKFVDVKIDTPTLITGITAKGFDVTCNTYRDGRIEVTLDPSNNNPIYRYSLAGPENRPLQDSRYFYDLPAGNYVVTVVSGKGCPATAPVTVGEPAPIVVNQPLVTPYLCNVGNTAIDATITVPAGSVSGGSNDYIRYQFVRDGKVVQDDERNVYTESDYLGGTYVVNVFDSKGCQGGYSSVTIDAYVDIARLDLVTTKINCRDDESVQVTAVPTRGTLPTLTYTIEGTNETVYPITNGVNGLFTGLKPGTYLIKVTNPVTGCGVEKPYFVNEPNTFKFVASNIKDVTCYADEDGAITLTLVDNIPTPTDEAGPFTYVLTHESGSSVSGSSMGTKVELSNLAAGKYTLVAELTGLPYCSVIANFTIGRPSAALEIKTFKKEITCVTGNDDGEIRVSAQGGWSGDYLYKLDGPITVDFSAQNIFSGLKAGLYTVSVKDAGGCIDTDQVTLIVPTPIVVVASSDKTLLLCNGDKSATITATSVTGGQGSNYLYTLNTISVTPVRSSGPQSTPSFAGLGAGTYMVTVTDGFNCIGESAPITINEPSEVKASLAETRKRTCLTDTQLTLTAQGGTAPYTYSADGVTYSTAPFASSISFDVAPGTYKYYVKDANGCVDFVSNEITIKPLEPLLANLDITHAVVLCREDASGVIVANATGGLGNYEYTLFDGAGNVLKGPQSEGRFDGLLAGDYKVVVKSGDCETLPEGVTINQPSEVFSAEFIPTPVKCFGGNDGRIEVIGKGGTGKYQYSISPRNDQYFDTNIFEKLKAGFYTVIATDENGCYDSEVVEVKQPSAPLSVVESPGLTMPEVCAGDLNGAFTIDFAGGTPPYMVSLGNINGTYQLVNGTQHTFENLAGGIYTVFVKDGGNCPQEVEVNVPMPVILNPTAEVTYDCVNNAQANMVIVTIDASNTDPTDVDYSLDNNGTFQPSNIFTNVPTGDHFIVARHTNGCEMPTPIFTVNAVAELGLVDVTNQSKDINTIVVKASGGVAPYEYSFNGESFSSSNSYRIYKTGVYKVIVRDKNGCEATIDVEATFYDFCLPNYFTPNGDGQNDTIGPDCGALAYKELTFDIYDRYGRVVAKYHVGQKWDGRYHGNELPTGDYWYVLKLNDPKDPREFVGHFTLYR